jgi:hypothetical protein
MRAFEQQLRAIPTVKNVSVAPAVGVWQGSTEPSWSVHYEGNGEARKLLARTGKQYTQDAVMLLHPVGTPGSVPSSMTTLVFPSGVSGQARDTIHEIMLEDGFSGATWSKVNGATVLRIVNVGADMPTHRAQMDALLKDLGETKTGVPVARHRTVGVEFMSDYDEELKKDDDPQRRPLRKTEPHPRGRASRSSVH